MSEQTAEPTNIEGTEDGANFSAKDISRMKRIGSWHATGVLAALTLWGAANAWAEASGLVLAHIVALGNAWVAATVMASVFHEWGHFTGAKLAGSIAPVAKKPVRLFFFFNFDMENNSVDQFVWMSLGGIIANWVLVLLLLLLVPLTTLAAALLVAVAVMKAVNVAAFEVPVVMTVRQTGEPQAALDERLADYGLRQTPGLIVGALTFLALT